MNNKQVLKIGYFADGPWSHEAFKLLAADNNFQIKFICPRSDTKDDTLKNFAEQYHIDYFSSDNINSEDFLEKIKRYECDILVSMSFNQIFKKSIIKLTPKGIINCHAGKLPFYRGRNILNWALINDEKEFGITVHYVDEGIDTGDIIMQRTFPISDEDNYSTLLQRAYQECARILYDSLVLIQKDAVVPIKQFSIHPVGMYCGMRKPGDEILDWNQSSRDIFNFVRAICKPGPMARATLNGKDFFINSVEYIPDAPTYKGIAGQILFKDGMFIAVKTLDSFIKIKEYVYDGKIKAGDRFDVK